MLSVYQASQVHYGAQKTMRPPRLWIVVAGEGHVKIYRRSKGVFSRITEEKMPLPALACFLDKAVQDRTFDRLFLIGMPDVLASLHALLTIEVAGRVAAEINRDMADQPEKEIIGYLERSMWL